MSLKNLDGVSEKGKRKRKSKRGKSSKRDGEQLESINMAVDAMQTLYDYLDKWPTQKEWNENRDIINISTSSKHFNRYIDKSFNDIKELAGADEESIHRIKKTRGVNISEDIKEPSTNKAYIYGVLLGDAYLHSTSNGYRSIRLETKDKEFAVGFGKRLCKWVNITWNGFNSENTDVTCSISSGSSGNKTWIISKGDTDLYNYLLDVYELNIPMYSLLNQFNNNQKKLMVRGLWDSEGSIRKDYKTIRFSNKNDCVINIYIELLHSLMDIDYNEFSFSSNNNVTNIRIPSKYLEEFYKIVNPTIKRKRNRFKKHLECDK